MSSFIPKLADHTAPLRDLLNRMLTLRGTHHTWEPLKRESLKSALQLLPRTTTEMNQFSFMLMHRSRAWVQLYSRTTDQKAFGSKALTSCGNMNICQHWTRNIMVYGCEKFHSYLYGRSFVVQSDHRPTPSKNAAVSTTILLCYCVVLNSWACLLLVAIFAFILSIDYRQYWHTF